MIASSAAVAGSQLRPAAAPPSSSRCSASELLAARRASSRRASTSCRCTAAVERCAAPADASSRAAAANALGRPSRRKQFDVVALSNLCVDIVVQVDQLPPADEPSRRALLQQLTAQPPPVEQWEVGGCCLTIGTVLCALSMHTLLIADGPMHLALSIALVLRRWAATPTS